jgi:RimJ/RimL family protein N-acetyltransferase
MGRVQLKTDVRNMRSRAAIEKIGATREGVLRRYQRRSDATVRDTVMYSVVAEEWPVVRDKLSARLN